MVIIMNDEKIISALQEANLLSNNNDYFIGTIMPNAKDQIMFGIFSNFVKEFSGYIINQVDTGIGIIPLSNMTGKPMVNNAYFLPQNNIKKVNIEKGGLFFYKKISIIDLNNQAITFKVTKNILPIKKYKENLERFIAKYQ